MALIGQSMKTLSVKNSTHTVTLAVNYPKLISAHAQISFLGSGEGVYGYCGLSQVVGATTGIENFWPPLPVIFRTNLLTATFYATAFDSGMLCHIVIDYWS